VQEHLSFKSIVFFLCTNLNLNKIYFLRKKSSVSEVYFEKEIKLAFSILVSIFFLTGWAGLRNPKRGPSCDAFPSNRENDSLLGRGAHLGDDAQRSQPSFQSQVRQKTFHRKVRVSSLPKTLHII